MLKQLLYVGPLLSKDSWRVPQRMVGVHIIRRMIEFISTFIMIPAVKARDLHL